MKNTYNKAKNWVSNTYQNAKKTITNIVSGGGSGNSFYQPSAYEKAKSSGQSSYNWFNSKLKEAGNILNSWTKGMERTVKHFCATAKRIKKDSADFIKSIDWRSSVRIRSREV